MSKDIADIADKADSAEAAPRVPALKLSRKRTAFLSKGTVVPPDVTHTTGRTLP